MTAAVAAVDWQRLDDELWKIRDTADTESPHASAQALIRWLHDTPTEGIEKSLDLSRSNVDAGVFEVIAAISAHGDHSDALVAVEELDKRVPNSTWHKDFVAIEAKLQLRLGHVEDARSLALEAADEVCPSPRACDAGIKEWLAKGTLPQAVVVASPKQPWLFDERGSVCESSWASDKLDEFASVDLIEASAGTRTAAQAQLAALWPSLVAGCVQAVDEQRLNRLLTLGWTKQELSDGFAGARKAVSEGSLAPIDLLGAKLALPDQQCDFALDATCSKTHKPLSKDVAVRIVERLQSLTSAWASAAPKESENKETKAESEARNRLADQYQEEMAEAAKLDATAGLARMREVLANGKYRNLGSSLNSYSFGQGLGRWSREGRAAEALQIFNLAADVAGPDFQSSPSSRAAAALLQLRSGEPKLALASLERLYAMDPGGETAKTIGKLRAALAGADIVQQYPPPRFERPWRYSRRWPICDFFDTTGGLARIEDVDLITAFHGERKAALWQLAQEWPSVVSHCFDEKVWQQVRRRLQRALGADGFSKAVTAAEESLELGSAPHFTFAEQELPLPDSEQPEGDGDQPPVRVTRERLLHVIEETHLLQGCDREPSGHCE